MRFSANWVFSSTLMVVAGILVTASLGLTLFPQLGLWPLLGLLLLAGMLAGAFLGAPSPWTYHGALIVFVVGWLAMWLAVYHHKLLAHVDGRTCEANLFAATGWLCVYVAYSAVFAWASSLQSVTG